MAFLREWRRRRDGAAAKVAAPRGSGLVGAGAAAIALATMLIAVSARVARPALPTMPALPSMIDDPVTHRSIDPGRGEFLRDRVWPVLSRIFDAIAEHRLVAVAAGVAFYLLLSIFPMIAAIVSLYGLFADPLIIADHIQSLQALLPSAVIDTIIEPARRFGAQKGSTLGFAFALSLLISLWSANAGVKALFDALNVVNEVPEKRSIVALNLRSLAVTAAAVLFIVLAITAIVAIPAVVDRIGLRSQREALLLTLRWPALLLITILGFGALYRIGPCERPARQRWISAGSVLAAILWMVGSMLFSWYVATLGTYNETYGSIGAVVVFMTWSWVSAIIVLVGAEFDAAREWIARQRLRVV